MQKINKIILKNFKFFYNEVTIPIHRKHILLYGENGSGKSSIYWALYTFLQSVFKTDNLEIRKYFDLKHEENLVNRFAEDVDESAIIIELEDEHGASAKRQISLNTINTKSDNLIKEMTLGSDFIDHKALSRIYNYYHKDDIDLFDFFQYNLLAFINFREDLIKPGEIVGSKSAEAWWSYFAAGLNPKPKMHEPVYKEFQAFINKFNTEFKYYIEQIEHLTNNYLRQRFEEKFKVHFEYVNGLYNDFKPNSRGRSWKVKPPQVLLTVELITDKISDDKKKKVSSPQSFLNEAKLSSLALAMRMAILDEKYVSAYPKLLVLDDMLLSMDMSNREFVLSLMLENYSGEYQIIFLTHQRGLFEDARKFIEVFHAEKARSNGETNSEIIKNSWKEEWSLFEMYESENFNGIPVPQLQKYETSLQKAFKYFRNPIDYNSCGNNLRIALEEFFREFIPSAYLVQSDNTPIPETGLMLDTLIAKARVYFTYVGFDIKPLDKLDRYRIRSLNPSSHYNPKTDYFKKELLDIFGILDELKKNRNDAVLATDDKIKFRIQTISRHTHDYTVLLLNDINLYKKSDGSASFFKDLDKRGYVMVEYSKDGGKAKKLNHELKKLTLAELYADTASHYTGKDAAILEADMYTIFTDENGKALNELKAY